ncbi:transmembrane protein 209 [Parasteatoda tepidariorum]|uniref:transmembrane protein 209 n=1 Tax=Parasteatoda tepidariorum TaxID=114398 RepID=UPI001C71E427|nr:transmembrane protein 209 [Parasteatoda tepidariorum]
MASLSYRTVQRQIFEITCEVLQMLRCYCLLVLWRLYRNFKTCYIIEILQFLYYSLFCNDRKMEWKTHWQSPVCRHILKRKSLISQSKSSLTWAACSFLLTFIIYLDLKSALFASFFGYYSSVVWTVETVICALFVVNGFAAVFFYIRSVVTKPLALSPMQQKLFRVTLDEPGFEMKQPELNVTDSKPESIRFSSFRDSFDYSPSLLSATPTNYSMNSWYSSSPSYTGLDTTSSSWSFRRMSSPLSYSTPKSPDRVSLRRLDKTADLESSYDHPIKNLKQLGEFLKVQEEERQKSMSHEDSKHFYSGVTSVENSPMSVLGKCLYQRAYRLPNAESTEDSSSEVHCGDNVLNKLKISDRVLTVWCERIRKWICQTILVKIVQEIDEINNTLTEISLPELQIGNVSLLTLNQLAMSKSQNLPTLSALLPYLDIHLNQEYLVKRLKTLARGGCMGHFKWNSGGSFNDKSWCEDMPTDSALIMHVLCCYLDAQLPLQPHFPEGKPFSSKYFRKTPEKPILSKDSYYIYQSCVNPPHFKVALYEDIYSLPKGRNNLFCTIAVLLHHIKTKECGMLGRVNLGRSGLNLLWVVD